MFNDPRPAPRTPTLGIELEDMRVAHRTLRLEQVLAVLRDRRRELTGTGPTPPGLTLAIDRFADELAQMRLGPPAPR